MSDIALRGGAQAPATTGLKWLGLAIVLLMSAAGLYGVWTLYLLGQPLLAVRPFVADRARQGEAGRRRYLERFTRRRMAECTWAVYEEALRSAEPAPPRTATRQSW